MSSKFQLNLSPGKLNLEFPGINISSEKETTPTDTQRLDTIEIVAQPTPATLVNRTHLSTAPTKIQSSKIDFLQCVAVAATIGIIAVQIYPPTWKVAEGMLRNPKTPLYNLLYAPTKSTSLKVGASPKPLPTDNNPVQIGEIIAGYRVTSGYGPRPKPCEGCSTFHPAIDVGTDVGTPLYAVIDANIDCFFQSGITGKYAQYPLGKLKPGYNLQLLHLTSCKPGPAKAGEEIATTGKANGAHVDVRVKSRIDGSRDSKNLRSLAWRSLDPKQTKY